MADFFKDIPHIKYKGSKSTDPFSFKYYDPDRMIDSKPMREHLKFALSYWHTMCAAGTDMFGGDIRISFIFSLAFPAIMIVSLILLRHGDKKRKKSAAARAECEE